MASNEEASPAGASEKSGTKLISTSEEMSEFSGKKSPRASKESVMFFLTNHLPATLLAKEQETPPLRCRRLRSWLIKHQPSNEYTDQALKWPEAATLKVRVKKCEVDVQMQSTLCNCKSLIMARFQGLY